MKDAGCVSVFFAAIAGDGEDYGKTGKESVLKLVTALLCSVYHICVKRGLDSEQLFGQNLALLDELKQVETIDGLKRKVLSVLNRFLVQSMVRKNSWKIVGKAMRYMDEHYRDDLSLESVARQVYVSPDYLSTLFTQEVQKNFLTCLHEIRINKANELLRKEYLKIYEVATAVGYNNEKYFSQIFKKLVGMTPNQYGESLNL